MNATRLVRSMTAVSTTHASSRTACPRAAAGASSTGKTHSRQDPQRQPEAGPPLSEDRQPRCGDHAFSPHRSMYSGVVVAVVSDR